LRQIDVADIGPPTINDFQVLINVEACGICGSDLHTFREDWIGGKQHQPPRLRLSQYHFAAQPLHYGA
jgi:D-arabinose 1-dehydrogenase-like Zn-dependent alcohol dehydrogenase